MGRRRAFKVKRCGFSGSFPAERILHGENTRQQTAFLDARLGEVRALAFQPSGETLLVAASGQGGRVWKWRWQDEQDHNMRGLEESAGAADVAVSYGGKPP